MMDKAKRKAIEAAGFQVGDAADFLGLAEEERRLVELRLKVARIIRRRREALDLTQTQAAAKIETTQPRFAKIEAAAPDVSLDQMFRGFFAVGGTVEDLATANPAAKRGEPASPRGGKGAKAAKSAKATAFKSPASARARKVKVKT